MKKSIVIFSIIAFTLGIFLCSYSFFKEGCNCQGIEVTPNLEIHSKRKGISYCKLLNCVINGSLECYDQFLKIDTINGSAGYDHGLVILEIIQLKGEEYFIDVIKDRLNKEEKINLLSYIEVAINTSSANISKPYKVLNYLNRQGNVSEMEFSK